jgi:hypothetical protein
MYVAILYLLVCLLAWILLECLFVSSDSESFLQRSVFGNQELFEVISFLQKRKVDHVCPSKPSSFAGWEFLQYPFNSSHSESRIPLDFTSFLGVSLEFYYWADKAVLKHMTLDISCCNHQFHGFRLSRVKSWYQDS